MTTFVSTVASFLQGARGLPREYFTSAAIYADELERLFLARWLCACREEEIARPGDYRLVEIAGESVMVLRDAGGRLRAFYNVCRHRGARLCEAPAGRLRNTIQCPYHAWTYRLDGSLAGAPHMQEYEGFDRRDYPLHAVEVGTWEGFVFVNLAADPEPLEAWLAPIRFRFSRFNISELRSARRIEYHVAANWKLIFQNYSECLHCPTIHPELAERTPYNSGENDLVEGPFLGGFMVLTDGDDSLTTGGEACAIPVGDLPPEDLRRVYFYSIMPNLLLSLHPDFVMFHTLWPESVGRTRIVCEWLFHPDAPGVAGFRPDDAIEFWDRTNRQDWHVCESTQAGVASRAYAPGPYSPRESLPAAWDREYLRLMRG
ncbi:MAG: aromatic ring-hydroxylating oxygenase subunit alpha [Longimicrobiales bacterium]